MRLEFLSLRPASGWPNAAPDPGGSASWLERLGAFVRAVGIVAACVLIPAQILVSLSYLVGRRIFNVPVTPLQELEWHFFFTLVFLTLGAALLADRHVRIDILRARLGERARAYIEIAGFVFALLPAAASLIYFGGQFAWESYLTGENSRAALGLPWRWIVKSMIPVGGLLLLAAGLVLTARNLSILRESRP